MRNMMLVFLLCFAMGLISKDIYGGILGDLTNALQDATGNKKNKKKKDESVGVPKAGFSIKYDGGLATPLWVEIVDHSKGRNLKYSWDFGDGGATCCEHGNHNLSPNPKHLYRKPGTYTIKLVVKNSFGEDTATETLSAVAIKPNADFDIKFDSTSVCFTDKSSGGNIVKWQWDFGDGNTSDERSPVYVYKKPGIYKVKLAVQNEFNLSSTRECDRQIVVFPKFSDTTEVENTIEPFGSITWRDSLLDVVVKMNNISGVESICMSLVHPNFECKDGVSVKGIINREGLIEKLSEGISLVRGVLPGEIFSSFEDMCYKDIDGKDMRCLHHEKYHALVVRASPVIISGIPFELKVYFTQAHGLAIEKPVNVYNETRFNCSLPLLIDKVVLESDSPRVKEGWDEIKELLYKKYGVLVKQTQLAQEKDKEGFHRPLSDWTVGAADYFGNVIFAECKPSSCVISYHKNIDYYGKELEAIYQKHLIDIESKKYEHLPESISGVVVIDKGADSVERIMPFGGLSWDDGLFDIVTKLNNIKGIDKVEIIRWDDDFNYFQQPSPVCDISGAMTKEEFTERLLGSIKHRSFESVFVKTYIDVNGKDAKYVGGDVWEGEELDVDLAIKATPVSIFGVPYSIVVWFRSIPGFILEYPQKTLFSHSGLAFPFIITKVSLFENSPILSCKTDVIDFCVAKYKGLGATVYDLECKSKKFAYDKRDGFDGRDIFGNHFSVRCTKAKKAKISYERPESPLAVFKEKYSDHIKQVELKKTKDKPNMGTDL